MPVASAVERGPRIRELNARQMECVLARNHLARVAFMCDGRIEVLPIHYVYAEGVVYGRTSRGTKSLVWLIQPEVVLEVDEPDGLLDWRSVIVRGELDILRARGALSEPYAYWNAIAAIRTLLPAAFTDDDPTPHRSLVFRVRPTSMTGREAATHSPR